jgi:mannitol/fructose-specific phosphotransferase system IIA component (Ntr-type)
LLGRLERGRPLRDLAEARRAIFEREAQMSTGMEKGVAIPHARTDAVDRLVCAVGLKPEGIDFGALDGQPSRIFVLSLSPKSASAPHVQFMAMISRTLGSDESRDRVLAATTAGELWTALLGSP